MKMDIILSKWCLAILFAFGILACTDGSDANELPKEPEGTGETNLHTNHFGNPIGGFSRHP